MTDNVKAMTSVIRQKLMQEATTLENNDEFMKRVGSVDIDQVILLIKLGDNHVHAVLPDDPESCKAMLKQILLDNYGIDADPKVPIEEVKLPHRIVFHNRQAIGDILMFTCGIRDFKAQYPNIQVQVNSTVPHIWDHNPNLERSMWVNILDPLTFWSGNEKPSPDQMLELNKKAIAVALKEDVPVRLYIGPGKLTNASNRKDLHFANAYRIGMEMALGVQISQGPIRPDIYMTQEEYEAPPIIEPPYWLITAGEKGDWTCKTFPFAKWQEVVEKLPQIKFVQLGSTAHKHPKLSGDNVVNFIGKTQHKDYGLRMLFNLFNNCEGSMGLVSFQMHLTAAFNKPCITIAGAREPVHFTRYPGQGGYLATDGCLPCTIRTEKGAPTDEPNACWYCSLERCPYHREYGEQEIPLCADLFTSDDVVRAIMRYYDGGRLSFDKPAGPSKLVNIVPNVKKMKGIVDSITPPKEVVEKNKEDIKKSIDGWVASQRFKDDKPADSDLWGFSWGGSSLTEEDWKFLKAVLEEYKIKTVLEFGAGLSTLLMRSEGADVTTYEVENDVADYVRRKDPEASIIQWDGITVKAVPNLVRGGKKYDLAFVDGPKGGENREHSIAYASEHANFVIVHDGGRKTEQKWQEMYLRENFYLVQKGGNRCHFWKFGDPLQFDLDDATEGVEILSINDITPEKFEELMESDGGKKLLIDTIQRDYEKEQIELVDKKIIKFVFNGRGDGGAEKSVCWMMNEFVRKGYHVEYISPNPHPCGTFKNKPIDKVVFLPHLRHLKDPCDILFLYTNDWVWEFPKLAEVFSGLKADRKVMGVNYKRGNIKTIEWCQGWDHYLFLNGVLREGCGKERIGVVLPPPTDLSIYLENQPDYEGPLKIIRHSSQGDTKYPKDFNRMVERILESIVPTPTIFLMPAPSFLDPHLQTSLRDGGFLQGGVKVHKRNQPPVPEFLKQGNVFWYALPGGGYTEGGPKVIMEAQASGLPIVADNHSGAVDRLNTKGTSGFLCNTFEDHLEALSRLNSDIELRKLMGRVNREHAKTMYDPQLWIKEIIKGKPANMRGNLSCIQKLI